jgi:hypothetical protein
MEARKMNHERWLKPGRLLDDVIELEPEAQARLTHPRPSFPGHHFQPTAKVIRPLPGRRTAIVRSHKFNFSATEIALINKTLL